MDSLKYCDFFKVNFHFNTNNYSAYYSIFGGLMFIIFILFTVSSFLFFSYDNLNKLLPITTRSEFPDIGNEIIKITEEKIWIPWRISTYEEQFINHKGLLYPVINLVHGKTNENKIIELEYKRLNYTLCSETSMAYNSNSYKIDINLNTLFCIDNDELYLGGSWNSGFIYYIEIDIYLCQNGKKFNKSDENCSSFEDLYNFRNKSLFFEFFYPEVKFKPSDYEKPLEVIYRNHFYEIKEYNSKYERIFLRKNILSDDRSLFKNKPNNISLLGIDSIYGDTYISEIYSNNNKNPSSKIFSLSIYMGKSLVYFTRYYKKFPVILSDVFPILYLIFFLFKETTKFIKLCFIKKRLFELLFEKSPAENVNKIEIHQNRGSFKNSIKNINIYNLKMKKYSVKNIFNEKRNTNLHLSHKSLNSLYFKNRNSKEIVHKRSNQSLSNLSNSNLGLNLQLSLINKNKNQNTFFYKSQQNIMEKQKITRSFILNSNNNAIKNGLYFNKNKKKVLFPFIFYTFDFFINKSKSTNKNCFVSKDYFLVYKFINKIYDISSFLILYKQFNIFKNYYAKGKLLDIVNSNSKININNKDLMEEISMNSLNNVFQTFSELLLRE